MNELASLDALAIGVNTIDVLMQLPDHYTLGEKCPAHDLVVQGGRGGGQRRMRARNTGVANWVYRSFKRRYVQHNQPGRVQKVRSHR